MVQKKYAYVLRYHNLGSDVIYETRILTSRDARRWYDSMKPRYDFVFIFKQL